MRDGYHTVSLRLNPETAIALKRLADAEGRSQNKQVAYLIRAAAASQGLWTPRQGKPDLRVAVTQKTNL